MKITDDQDTRLALLFPGTWNYTKRTAPEELPETAIGLLVNADESLKAAKRKGSPFYSASRHMAIKALIKELETGKPATDPMVEAATRSLT